MGTPMTASARGRLPSPGFWKGKRVLVTGHTGFKGSWLTAWLAEMGAEVAGVSLPQPPTSPSLWEDLDLSVALDVRSDLCSDEWQRAVVDFDPQTIIHLAAQALVIEGHKFPLRTFQTNVMGTAQVLDTASNLRSLESVLVATTDKVYDPGGLPPYAESSRLGGADPYSASKTCAEMVVRSWPHVSVPIVTARAGNVVGGGDWSDHRLVPDLVRSWSASAAAEIRQPSAIRPWQHVLEPLAGYLVYLERLTQSVDLPRSMNFGPSADQAVAVREVAALAAQQWAAALDLAQIPTCTEIPGQAVHETATLLIDSSQALSMLDWRGRLDWRAAVSMTIDWYAAHTRGDDVGSLLRAQLRRYVDRSVEVNR